ncbi:MAG: MurR/RpiR family transcriptional regulator, partial [Acetobacteraceae bacterium]|nr:MurR/RpiR family transcriptional regulator [Acetobacteraceae bacterium]
MIGSALYNRINEAIPHLTEGERAVAQYIVDHYQRAAFLSSVELGLAAGVSDTTVVRLARALGYSGYTALKKDLQELLRQKITPGEKLQTASRELGRGRDYVRALYQLDVHNLRRTFAELDLNTLARVVEAVDRAPQIFLMGLGVSASVVHFLDYRLRRCGKSVVEITAGGYTLTARLTPMAAGDLLLAIDVPRYSRDTLAAMKYARQIGAATVLITDSALTPLQQWSN